MYCRMMAAIGGLILTWSSQYCSDPQIFGYHSKFTVHPLFSTTGACRCRL